ncbi:hypothetical protein EF513_03010 [Rickettsiales endosymbiont of Stachyamoeba lipophora]|nr:hypothetical protein EF513_03010 [Rickettsiales endosymbiont of Stachyamoeba lipophora]
MPQGKIHTMLPLNLIIIFTKIKEFLNKGLIMLKQYISTLYKLGLDSGIALVSKLYNSLTL